MNGYRQIFTGVLVTLFSIAARAELVSPPNVASVIEEADHILIGRVVQLPRAEVHTIGKTEYMTFLVSKTLAGQSDYSGSTIQIMLPPETEKGGYLILDQYGLIFLRKTNDAYFTPANPKLVILPAIQSSHQLDKQKDPIAAVAFELSNVLRATESSQIKTSPYHGLPVFGEGEFSVGQLELHFNDVVRHINNLPPSYTAPLLKTIIKGNHSKLSKAWAISALLHINDATALEIAVPALVNITERGPIGTPTATALASSLYSIHVSGVNAQSALLKCLDPLLGSNYVNVRRAAASAARNHLSDEALPLLLKAINDPNQDVRYLGAYGLALLTELKPAYANSEYQKHELELLRFWREWAKNNGS